MLSVPPSPPPSTAPPGLWDSSSSLHPCTAWAAGSATGSCRRQEPLESLSNVKLTRVQARRRKSRLDKLYVGTCVSERQGSRGNAAATENPEKEPVCEGNFLTWKERKKKQTKKPRSLLLIYFSFSIRLNVASGEKLSFF